MTTCAITECRNDGVMLLHIRFRKENLLQAEYCAQHFSEQAFHWAEDIKLANEFRIRSYYRTENDYGNVRETTAEAIKWIWQVRDSLPRHTPIDQVHNAIVESQKKVHAQIAARKVEIAKIRSRFA